MLTSFYFPFYLPPLNNLLLNSQVTPLSSIFSLPFSDVICQKLKKSRSKTVHFRLAFCSFFSFLSYLFCFYFLYHVVSITILLFLIVILSAGFVKAFLVNKNVPWRIPVLRAVACNNLHLRASTQKIPHPPPL